VCESVQLLTRRLLCLCCVGMCSVFKEEWAEVKEQVFAMFGITAIQTECLARTARRMGKTASVAMFCVAVLENVPGIKICIFSTGQRASSALMTEIKRLLKKVPNGTDRIVKETQEELRFAPAAVGNSKAEKRAAELSDDVAVLYSYPGGTTSQCAYTYFSLCV
jgi:branched-subunit amino acid transport protein